MAEGFAGGMVRMRLTSQGRWETWIAPEYAPKVRGRAKRKQFSASCEAEAMELARGYWASVYPALMLTGEKNAAEVAVACLDAQRDAGRWPRGEVPSGYVPLIRNHFARLVPRDAVFSELSRFDLQCMCDKLASEGRIGAVTIKKLFSALAAAFDYLIAHRVIEDNPAHGIKVPRGARKVARALSEPEYAALMAALESELSGECSGAGAIFRRNALFGALVAIYTGARVGEVCALRRGDVRVSADVITIDKSLSERGGLHVVPPKTARGARSVAMPDALSDAVVEHYRWQAGYLTGEQRASDLTPLCCLSGGGWIAPKRMSGEFKALCGRTEGINLARGESFHVLRHAHASMLLMGKGNVNAISAHMGHASISTTADIYGHSMASDEADIAASFAEAEGRVRRAGGAR